ncbi:Aminoacyl-histidine dipeptidase [Aduncisulcus paluster]|uniref:Aminoacyl-histidine dipeptidase n=1 Tax=Aduncisulcus paluster TaxID=2918883 RepID=A0ABQ5KIQ2_9EUKA|nr:Aminoacyl-histidine dipeptidase [Aduncisulcus paluster]|eukprot:gnl/Carplike_NY0171/459_a638_3132.p1 GENE.gnl/Carplike_NY0171/459_a638_3132~~gnl/Carplike_NY0171/459_a638_3132.p1  ORF type:complete len:497 (+),score=180.81 gnl/Carplike_NY0171/459_a638_3132:34-1524(+)
MPVLKTKACQEIIKQLPGCPNVWQIFLAILEVPNPSHYSELIVKFMVEVGKEYGFETVVDETNNVILRVPATEGCESWPIVCLQGHTDMVPVKADEIDHDFKTMPIVPRIDGEWLKATQTTLGADNGIGIAMAVAAAIEPGAKHGPLEILCTSDEEVGLIGASAIKPGFVKSQYIINLDSEDAYALCFGCAGGYANHWTGKMTREAYEGTALTLTVNKLTGGHSGCDIHLSRGNALKWQGRMLTGLRSAGIDFRVVSIDGGQAHNAIPGSCVVQLVTPEAEKLTELVTKLGGELKKMFKKTDPNAIVSVTPAEAKFTPMNKACTDSLIDFLLLALAGPQRMSPVVEGLVETSYTTAVIKTTEEEIDVLGSGRSSIESAKFGLFERCCAIGRGVGWETSEMLQAYPGWAPDLDSKLLKTMKVKHLEVLGKEAHCYSIHAGLEAGLLVDAGIKAGRTMDAISMGPTIKNPHSPDEALLIDTVPEMYKLLLATLADFSM